MWCLCCIYCLSRQGQSGHSAWRPLRLSDVHNSAVPRRYRGEEPPAFLSVGGSIVWFPPFLGRPLCRPFFFSGSKTRNPRCTSQNRTANPPQSFSSSIHAKSLALAQITSHRLQDL